MAPPVLQSQLLSRGALELYPKNIEAYIDAFKLTRLTSSFPLCIKTSIQSLPL